MDDESIAARVKGLAPVPVAVTIAVLVGVGGALAGFIDGIVLINKQTYGRCHRGSYDVFCWTHPRAGEGIAITAISLSVGAIVLLLAYIAKRA